MGTAEEPFLVPMGMAEEPYLVPMGMAEEPYLVPMGTAKEPIWNPFFSKSAGSKRPYRTCMVAHCLVSVTGPVFDHLPH